MCLKALTLGTSKGTRRAEFGQGYTNVNFFKILKLTFMRNKKTVDNPKLF